MRRIIFLVIVSLCITFMLWADGSLKFALPFRRIDLMASNNLQNTEAKRCATLFLNRHSTSPFVQVLGDGPTAISAIQIGRKSLYEMTTESGGNDLVTGVRSPATGNVVFAESLILYEADDGSIKQANVSPQPGYPGKQVIETPSTTVAKSFADLLASLGKDKRHTSKLDLALLYVGLVCHNQVSEFPNLCWDADLGVAPDCPVDVAQAMATFQGEADLKSPPQECKASSCIRFVLFYERSRVVVGYKICFDSSNSIVEIQRRCLAILLTKAEKDVFDATHTKVPSCE